MAISARGSFVLPVQTCQIPFPFDRKDSASRRRSRSTQPVPPPVPPPELGIPSAHAVYDIYDLRWGFTACETTWRGFFH